MDWKWIIDHLITLAIGMTAGWSVKLAFSRRTYTRTSKVKQSGNFAGGDIVAGDMNKNNRG